MLWQCVRGCGCSKCCPPEQPLTAVRPAACPLAPCCSSTAPVWLQLGGQVTYNGKAFNQFNAPRTAAYVYAPGWGCRGPASATACRPAAAWPGRGTQPLVGFCPCSAVERADTARWAQRGWHAVQGRAAAEALATLRPACVRRYQGDNHVAQLTTRETLDFSARCQGVGRWGGAPSLACQHGPAVCAGTGPRLAVAMERGHLATRVHALCGTGHPTSPA